MQTKWWGDFKAANGWQAHHALDLSVLENAPRLNKSFLYIPEISISDDHLPAMAAKASSALNHFKKSNTVFGRAEFLVPYSDEAAAVLRQGGFIKAKDEVQPEHRQEIDITPLVQDILAQMKPKGRYNIGVAQKHGVEVVATNQPDDIVAFIKLNEQTTKRKKISGRGGKYLRDLIQLLETNGAGGLWVAKYQGDVLAGAIVALWQGKASYLYGASSDQNRNVMAPYLLHFTIISDAKKFGCSVYDMIGVAPENASPKHPWHGISRFKREFGGQTVHYLGSFDKVYNPVWYKLYQLGRKK